MTNVTNAVKVQFTFRGAPIGKPRMTRRDQWYTRPIVADYWQFKADLQKAARNAGYQEDGARLQEIHARAYLPVPKSWPKKRKAANMGRPHTSTPDADNILKAIADALTDNDASVWNVSLRKYWDDGAGERLEVEIVAAYDL